VLLHGVGLDHHLWDDLRARLSPARTVVAYDLIGHGDGPHPAGPYTIEQYVAQLHAAVVDASDAAGGGPVDVGGFSMGALIAQAFAAQHPLLVHRLILIAAVFHRSPAERAAVLDRVAAVRAGEFAASVEAALSRWFTPAFAHDHPSVVAAVRARMETNDVRAYADAYEVFATADESLVAATRRITAPTLVIAGEDDPRSTPAMAHALADRVPNGRAVVLPDRRHCVMLEDPEGVAALVEWFLTDPLD
jgi:pimeloyl-ACP methyl ester carboxylesterase